MKSKAQKNSAKYTIKGKNTNQLSKFESVIKNPLITKAPANWHHGGFL